VGELLRGYTNSALRKGKRGGRRRGEGGREVEEADEGRRKRSRRM